MKASFKGMVVAALMFCGHSAVFATELTYTPVNPNFGGNALNGNFLLGGAQAINNYKDPNATTFTRPSDLDRLVSSLQSRLLSQVLSDAADGKAGAITTDQFSLIVSDVGDGSLEVKVTDLLTGEETRISVNNAVFQ